MRKVQRSCEETTAETTSSDARLLCKMSLSDEPPDSCSPGEQHIETTKDSAVRNDPLVSESESVRDLRLAVADWVERGRRASIARWFARELDPEGVPRHLPVPDWVSCLALLAAARRHHGDWPERFDARIEGLFRGILRFARPDGTAVFSPPGPAGAGRRALFREWAERLPDAGLTTVVDWWFPARKEATVHAPPPLPAWSRPGRPLAVLRADWSKEGDLLALDHRVRDAAGAVELVGLGHTWIGPTWTSGTGDVPATRARLALWVSNPSVDVAEWTCRVGEARIVRTAVLLRVRRLALLAEQVEGRDPNPSLRLTLAERVAAGPISGSRGLTLTTRRGRPSARAFPVGLPRLPYPTERGSFSREGRDLVLRQKNEGRRCWLPLVVSWEPQRNRLPVHWRTLTVSEKSRICPPDIAFAARISWGRDETLLLYRSLARPALRAVLGHHTRARFLIGLFDRNGDVEPLLKVED